jgi:hypothetical protein
MDTNRYKETLERELALLTKMRDELKVQMHLAKADAKDEWAKLEKNWLSVQDELKRVSGDAKEPLKELGAAARGLVGELKTGYERIKNSLQN